MLFLALLPLLQLVAADSQFRSRPDLSPPRLNITVPANGTNSNEYIFVAPYGNASDFGSGPVQTAGYIFRDDGDLVWSSLGYLAGWIANLKPTRYRGQDVLQAFQGSIDSTRGRGWGVAVFLDAHYDVVATVASRGHERFSLHELQVVDEKTALFEVYQPVAKDLRDYGGAVSDRWIVDGIFQEIDIATGNVVFAGHSLDFASPKDSVLLPPSGRSADAPWDYFHLNSIDKDKDGNYLLSARHTHTIYKLDRNGQVLWQLGGTHSSFRQENDWSFAFQHDARFLDQSSDGTLETISLFDNGASKVDGKSTASRALVVQLNHTSKKASVLRELVAPHDIVALSQGNAQVLVESGHVFVNWGQAGAVTEYDQDGEVVFHAFLDSDERGKATQNYRGFRGKWTGHAREAPAIVALSEGSDKRSYERSEERRGERNEIVLGDNERSEEKESEDKKNINIYVSWNGDTRVDQWTFFVEVDDDQIIQLGHVKRTSFETTWTVDHHQHHQHHYGNKARFFAQGHDIDGNVLTTTGKVAIDKDVLREWEL